MSKRTLDQRKRPRYQKKRLAGRGMRARVFECLDQNLKRPVALKEALEAGDATVIIEEGERLARVRNPHVIQVHDLILTPSPALVLEWLDGQSLRAAMNENRSELLPQLHRIVSEILIALEACHENSIVHGDVKPENIYLRSNGSVVLFDFGAQPQAGGDATALYAAPEVLGGEAPSPSSDLYSLACLTFELLTGSPPFDGVDIQELTQRKSRQEAPRVRERGGATAEAVEAWIEKGLQRQASRRFDSTLEARQLWSGAGAGLQRENDQSAGFVLHPEAFTRLTEILSTPRLASGASITLTGPSGVGKSTLLRQSLTSSPTRRILQIQPCNSDRSATAGVSWNAAIARFGLEYEHNVEALYLNSELHVSLQIPSLMKHVRRMSSSTPGLTITVDSFDDCDPASLEIIEKLASAADALGLLIIVVSDDADQAAEVRTHWCTILDACRENLRLAPPSNSLLQELAAQHLQVAEISSALASYISERSGNNPRYALLILDVLRDQGALEKKAGTWLFRAERTTNDIPRVCVPFLERLLQKVGEEERAVLEQAAIHGRNFHVSLLANTTGRTIASLEDVCHRLATTTSILEQRQGEYAFREPLLLEYLYQHVDPEHRKQVHKSVADMLREDFPEDETSIGIHLFRAEERDAALPYLLRAGKKALEKSRAAVARKIFDFAAKAVSTGAESEDEARDHVDILLSYGEALRLNAAWEEALIQLQESRTLSQAWGLEASEVRALRGMGDIEYARGSFDRAIEFYQQATQTATEQGNDREAREIELRVGNIHFERGQLDDALLAYAGVLEYAAMSDDTELEARCSNNLGLAHSSLGHKNEAIQLFNRSLELFRALDRSDAMARIYHNIGMTYLELKNWAEARNYFERCIPLSEEFGLDTLRAVSSLDHAEASLKLGQRDVARSSVERALALCTEREDRLGIATAYRLQGILAAQESQSEEAVRKLGQSIAILREMGETPHLSLALKDLAEVHLDIGDAESCASLLQEAGEIFHGDETQHEVAGEIARLWARCRKAKTCRP